MCRSGSLRQEEKKVADNEKKDNRYEHVCICYYCCSLFFDGFFFVGVCVCVCVCVCV